MLTEYEPPNLVLVNTENSNKLWLFKPFYFQTQCCKT